MGPRKPLNAGLLLGVTDLIIVAVYRGSLDVLLAGLLYLMVANFLCFLGMILAAISRRNGTTNIPKKMHLYPTSSDRRCLFSLLGN